MSRPQRSVLSPKSSLTVDRYVHGRQIYVKVYISGPPSTCNIIVRFITGLNTNTASRPIKRWPDGEANTFVYSIGGLINRDKERRPRFATRIYGPVKVE